MLLISENLEKYFSKSSQFFVILHMLKDLTHLKLQSFISITFENGKQICWYSNILKLVCILCVSECLSICTKNMHIPILFLMACQIDQKICKQSITFDV